MDQALPGPKEGVAVPPSGGQAADAFQFLAMVQKERGAIPEVIVADGDSELKIPTPAESDNKRAGGRMAETEEPKKDEVIVKKFIGLEVDNKSSEGPLDGRGTSATVEKHEAPKKQKKTQVKKPSSHTEKSEPRKWRGGSRGCLTDFLRNRKNLDIEKNERKRQLEGLLPLESWELVFGEKFKERREALQNAVKKYRKSQGISDDYVQSSVDDGSHPGCVSWWDQGVNSKPTGNDSNSSISWLPNGNIKISPFVSRTLITMDILTARRALRIYEDRFNEQLNLNMTHLAWLQLIMMRLEPPFDPELTSRLRRLARGCDEQMLRQVRHMDDGWDRQKLCAQLNIVKAIVRRVFGQIDISSCRANPVEVSGVLDDHAEFDEPNAQMDTIMAEFEI